MDTTRIRTAAIGGTSSSLATKKRAALAVFAGAGIITALAGCAPAQSDETTAPAAESTSGTTETSPSAAASESTSGSSSSSGEYTDGTYEATGQYTSPGGQEQIDVSITLEGGVVSAVTVTPEATSGNSAQYQRAFASGISAEVVGKNIDDLQVDKVSGSSLTSGGFNEAVETIKSEATA